MLLVAAVEGRKVEAVVLVTGKERGVCTSRRLEGVACRGAGAGRVRA